MLHAYGEGGQVFVAAIVSLQGSGQAQDCVEVGLGSEAVFSAGGSEGGEIAGDEIAIETGVLLSCAVDGKRELDVSADEIVLEGFAEFRFKRIESGG